MIQSIVVTLFFGWTISRAIEAIQLLVQVAPILIYEIENVANKERKQEKERKTDRKKRKKKKGKKKGE